MWNYPNFGVLFNEDRFLFLNSNFIIKFGIATFLGYLCYKTIMLFCYPKWMVLYGGIVVSTRDWILF